MSFGCTAACKRPAVNSSQCHCTACHQTFRHLGDFETHRQGPTDTRYCVWPVKLGLVSQAGVWATSESHEKAAVAAARLAGSRSSSTSQDALASVGGTPVGVAG